MLFDLLAGLRVQVDGDGMASIRPCGRTLWVTDLGHMLASDPEVE